ncbi:hypothetical protein B0H17DRAFT_1210393 [Mycena rosella]|uniref:Uncharacterized protein n=1 Tax=Mycena rosella TaxID=1033263 RepID=A0AAD7G8I2_MYCRO|nr:hypothetical protein B0H17DRAFT_1210393 [Mycena rosella]
MEVTLDSQNHVSPFIRALTQLQSLDVDSLDVAALVHLGRLRTLEVLSFTLPASISFPPASDGMLFGRLQSTKIKVLGGPINTLSAFSEGRYRGPATPEAMEEFYHALSEHCAPSSLEVLRLYTGGPPAPRFVHPGVCSGICAASATLRCFGSTYPPGTRWTMRSYSTWHAPGPTSKTSVFARLRMSIPHPAGHTPRPVRLRRALPAPSHPRNGRPRIERRGVDDGAGTGRQVRQRSLVSLVVHRSPISDAPAVAQFLSSIFPNLTGVAFDSVGTGSGTSSPVTIISSGSRSTPCWEK